MITNGIHNLTRNNLSHFYGSDQIYYNPLFRRYKYTEGVKFISDNGAAWLITDILAFVGGNKKLSMEEFIVATLKVKDGKAILTFDDGNDNILFTHKYESTDFPLDNISFYLEWNTLMLPSER
jgi:hypothetical protein